MNTQIIETKKCRECSTEFDVTQDDLDYLKLISPVIGDKKILIPPSVKCPECRRQQRLVWRNESSLYKRKCEKTGKVVISLYPEESPYTVYEMNYWQSDAWDPMDYGQEYDFTKTFFEQYRELQLKVPRRANNLHTDAENSDFCNQCWHIKDCYLCFNVGYAEDCYYCWESYFIKKCMDCFYVKNSELCYRTSNSNKCFNTFYSDTIQDSSNVFFSYDCTGCSDIFMCSNLRNKQYCFRNKQYTKEEYKEILIKAKLGDYEFIQKMNQEFEEMKAKAIHKENNNFQTNNCKGDYLTECKDCSDCFNMYRAENCKYIHDLDSDAVNCRDMNYLAEAENCYHNTMVAGFNNCFSMMTVYGQYNFYCDNCNYPEHCFGCIAIKNKKYCILNKEYTKEEYEELVVRIIEKMKEDGEWGEFFPISTSPFCYNETVAQTRIPLTKEEAQKLGSCFRENEKDITIPEGVKSTKSNDLPSDIHDIDETILKKVLIGEVSGKPFRIIGKEYEFYKKYNIPLARKHPDIRQAERFVNRNPRQFFKRKCDNCSKEMTTTYSPEKKIKVFCEECYEKEIY